MNRFNWLRDAYTRYPTITDGVIAAVLLGFILGWYWLYFHNFPQDERPTPQLIFAVGLTVFMVVPLIGRRHFPLTVLGLVTVGMMLFWLDSIIKYYDFVEPTLYHQIAYLLALMSAAAYSYHRLRNWVCTASVVAEMGRLTTQLIVITREDSLYLGLLTWSTVIIYPVFWWLGNAMRARREKESELTERTAQLEREREENARRAVFEERVRIARELHDVVAHHVSVMGVQAGAARRVMDGHPAKAKDALSSIEIASRQAVTELQRLLGFLRQAGERDGVAPQASMRNLGVLVGKMREAGLHVAFMTDGEERPLPTSIDLSAYRIVQEALTNTLKHAGPSKSSVTVRYEDDAVEVEILDDGGGQAAGTSHDGSGVGLIGMKERVSLHGGELETGPRASGGFLVRAKLPLNGGS